MEKCVHFFPTGNFRLILSRTDGEEPEFSYETFFSIRGKRELLLRNGLWFWAVENNEVSYWVKSPQSVEKFENREDAEKYILSYLHLEEEFKSDVLCEFRVMRFGFDGFPGITCDVSSIGIDKNHIGFMNRGGVQSDGFEKPKRIYSNVLKWLSLKTPDLLKCICSKSTDSEEYQDTVFTDDELIRMVGWLKPEKDIEEMTVDEYVSCFGYDIVDDVDIIPPST